MIEREFESLTHLPSAVVFDMDGVLVDSNPFHLEKWRDFLTERQVRFDPDQLPILILGQRNDTALRYFFGDGLSPEERKRLGEELEAAFRRAFKAHAKPLAGLETFIKSVKAAGIPMAVASSAMMKNVRFIVDALGFHNYFRLCVSGDDVSHPKPDPEIYLKASHQLGFKPETCVAFEDSFVGIESAKGAGMKCVGIASTFPLEDLKSQTDADLVVPSFEGITVERLRELFRY